jgi:hypothetical protein
MRLTLDYGRHVEGYAGQLRVRFRIKRDSIDHDVGTQHDPTADLRDAIGDDPAQTATAMA